MLRTRVIFDGRNFPAFRVLMLMRENRKDGVMDGEIQKLPEHLQPNKLDRGIMIHQAKIHSISLDPQPNAFGYGITVLSRPGQELDTRWENIYAYIGPSQCHDIVAPKEKPGYFDVFLEIEYSDAIFNFHRLLTMEQVERDPDLPYRTLDRAVKNMDEWLDEDDAEERD